MKNLHNLTQSYRMGKYINVQMNREVHEIVKNHCKTSKQSISGCIEKLVLDNLIKDRIKPKNSKIELKGVLRVASPETKNRPY